MNGVRVEVTVAAAIVASTLTPFICAHAADPAGVRVILVGDSTMAAGSGYGDALCGLFLWQVECVNLARGGRLGSFAIAMRASAGRLRERSHARRNAGARS